MELLHDIFLYTLATLGLKSIWLGSEFNFMKWMKNGKKYIKEYNEWYEKKP